MPDAATLTTDLFMTLDGFGTGPVGYWGKDGPQLREQRAHRFFAAEGQRLLFGANTYRAMAGFAARSDDEDFAALRRAPKFVVSRTLSEPLAMENSTLIEGDALEAVPRLKAESTVPLRCHGSITMNRALLAAGMVDRLEVTIFPVITGETGENPILADLPDIDLELVDSVLLDGRIQQLVYVPTVR